MEITMNKNKLFLPIVMLVGLLFTACDKDEIVRTPMELTWDILTPESVQYEGGSLGWAPKDYFKANGQEGDIVMTCKNYDSLYFAETSTDSYDCGWASLRIEANKLRIHFPYNVSDAPEVSEEITIIGRDGKKKATAIIVLTRTFEGGEQPGPEAVPEAAKFKMHISDVEPFMHLDSPLPAPTDLISFRITDINGNYTHFGFPEYTHYYDSIVWSADDLPHTFKVYEGYVTEGISEQHFITQWSSHFFKKGTVKTRLKGYSQGKVAYETSLDVSLCERDFLGIEWGVVVLQKPANLTTYCLLDRNYEYTVYDVTAKDGAQFSKIVPVNHKSIPISDFIAVARKAVMTLMGTNVGAGQSAKGKESLFKCLPEKDVEAELYWENKTSRMIMLHKIPGNPDDLTLENYYLHIEPKQ